MLSLTRHFLTRLWKATLKTSPLARGFLKKMNDVPNKFACSIRKRSSARGSECHTLPVAATHEAHAHRFSPPLRRSFAGEEGSGGLEGGGAAIVTDGALTLVGCYFVDNNAWQGEGGAVRGLRLSQVDVADSLFLSNWARTGRLEGDRVGLEKSNGGTRTGQGRREAPSSQGKGTISLVLRYIIALPVSSPTS